jgi:hypothetical protein
MTTAQELRNSEEKKKAETDLSEHQKAIINYAVTGATASFVAATDQVVARTHVVVQAEINKAFEAHNKLSTSRKIGLGVGAVLVFTLGWIGKGLVSSRAKVEEPNSMKMVD